MKGDDIETHTLEVNDHRFRLTYDPWTGDWGVEKMYDNYPQPYYIKTKQGAINYCLVEGSIVKRSEVEYKKAPDRTSA